MIDDIFDVARQLIYFNGVEWARRNYSYEQVNEAGMTLIKKSSKPLDIMQSLAIINNWRAAHAFPLNTMQVRLRDKAGQVGQY